MNIPKYSSLIGSSTVAGAIFAAGMMIAGSASAGGVAASDVKFTEDNSVVMASVSGAPGDAAAGRKAFANRKQGNCLACHTNADMPEQQFHGEIGPALEGVNERYKPAQLRAILVDAKKALSETTMMPGFYSLDLGVRITGKFKDKTVLSAQQVEDILAYLQTLK